MMHRNVYVGFVLMLLLVSVADPALAQRRISAVVGVNPVRVADEFKVEVQTLLTKAAPTMTARGVRGAFEVEKIYEGFTVVSRENQVGEAEMRTFIAVLRPSERLKEKALTAKAEQTDPEEPALLWAAVPAYCFGVEDTSIPIYCDFDNGAQALDRGATRTIGHTLMDDLGIRGFVNVQAAELEVPSAFISKKGNLVPTPPVWVVDISGSRASKLVNRVEISTTDGIARPIAAGLK